MLFQTPEALPWERRYVPVIALWLTFCSVIDSSNLKRGGYIGEEDFMATPNKMARIEEPKRGITFSFQRLHYLSACPSG